MKRLVGEVPFVVEGSAVVAHARDIAKDGQWDKAAEFLIESIIGFPLEYANGVLRGDMTLTGNSKDQNVMLEEDNDSEKYKKKVHDLYFEKYFFDENQLFKFSHILKGEDIEDAVDAFKSKTEKRFFLVGNNQAIVASVEDSNAAPFCYYNSEYYQSATDFYNQCSTNLKNNVKYLSKDDEQADKFIKMQKVLKADILKACKERNVTWENISFKNVKGEIVERLVPMELAFAYIARDSNIWKPISPNGLKMYNDSAFHSDLWLAMGYDIDGQEYNTNNPETAIFYHLMNEIRFKYNNAGDFDTLNDTKMSIFKGRVVFEDAKDITDKDILVLPNANLKYEAIAKKAGMVITESGGPVSHLVIVGREEMFPVIIMKDAINKLRNYRDIEVNFNDKNIKGMFR